MTESLPRRSMLQRVATLTAAGAMSSAAGAAMADGGVTPTNGSSPIDFGADPTGGRDATEALRRWLAQGGDLVLPAGSRFAVSDTVTITRPGTRIGGRGSLIARAGVVRKPLLAVAADDCVIDGISLENPDRVGAADGLQSFGIELFGHRNRVLNCTVHDFQMCLGVAPTGEFYDNVFAFNHCRVLGAALEDRGDGIADFGARTRIIGNMIEAASGRDGKPNDCRIGIDVEALVGLERDARNPDDNAGSEVIGNVVVPSPDGSGRFRRCYSVEGIPYCRIIGNYGRGWTWDALWLVGSSHHSVVTGNVFRQDLVGYSRSGAEWVPDRAGILIYATLGVSLHDVLVSDNIVDIGSADYNGIHVRNAGGNVSGITLSNNLCTIAHRAANAAPCGLLVSDARDVWLTGNRVDGPWRYGVRVQSCQDVQAVGCRISGVEGFALSAQGSTIRFGLNSIWACGGGIEMAGNTDYLIDGNIFNKIGSFGLSLVDNHNGIVANNVSQKGIVKVLRLGDKLEDTFVSNIGFAE